MILLLAPNKRLAKEWLRASGTDPAECVIVTSARQVLSIGVYDRHNAPTYSTAPPEFYDAWEFREVVEVGAIRWWDNSDDAQDCLRAIRQEIAEFQAEVAS